VTSGFAASLLSRRYLLGPLIALALVGANPSAPLSSDVIPGATSTPSPSPTPTSPQAAAEKAILLAHDAEGIYFVDNLVYAAGVGGELTALRGIEPNVVWGTEVVVQLPTAEGVNGLVAILRAPITGGGSLCIAEVSEVLDAGTYFARVAGAAKCPARKKGMPGWSEDQAVGWTSP
jgi:hypothetical protein